MASDSIALSLVEYYLPHFLFFLYKSGQSLFMIASKLYVYDVLCLLTFQEEPPANTTETIAEQTSTLRYQHTTMGSTVQLLTGLTGFSDVSTSLTTGLPQIDTESVVTKQSTAVCSGLTGKVEDSLQVEAAYYIMGMKLLQDIPAFLLGIFFGAWINRLGERIPIMIACVGGAIIATLFAFLQLAGTTALPGILVGFALSSITGRNAMVASAIQRYVLERTAKSERIGQLRLILGMSFLGLFFGALLIGCMGNMTPFWGIFLTVLFFFLICSIVAFFLKKPAQYNDDPYPYDKYVTVTTTARFHDPNSENNNLIEKIADKSFSIKLLLQNYNDMVETLTKPRADRKRLYLCLVFACVFIQNLCKACEVDILLLYSLHSPFSMSNSLFGWLLTLEYGITAIFMLFVTRNLLQTFPDTNILTVFVITKAVGFFWLSFSTEIWMVFVSVCFLSAFGTIVACLQSITMKLVEPVEYARCFSIINSIEIISDALGIVFFTVLYVCGLHLASALPVVPFFVGGVLHLVIFALALVVQLGMAPIVALDTEEQKKAEKTAPTRRDAPSEIMSLPLEPDNSSSDFFDSLHPVSEISYTEPAVLQ